MLLVCLCLSLHQLPRLIAIIVLLINVVNQPGIEPADRAVSRLPRNALRYQQIT